MKYLTEKGLKFTNYIIMYLVFAIGGIPFFSIPKEVKVLFTIFLIILAFKSKIKIDLSIVIVLFLVLLVFLAQVLNFGEGSFINYGYLIIIFISGYLAVKVVGTRFPEYYVNITYFFAIIALGFYFLSIISPIFYDFTSIIAPTLGTDPTGVVSESFIIYTFESKATDFLRNPGPFWEPGAYATFLILALIFNVVYKRKLNDKKNWIFILSIITTQSTAGYIALFVLLIGYSLLGNFAVYKKVVVSIFFIASSVIVFTEAPFLENKITDQFTYQSSTSLNTPTSGRFLAARKDLVAISRYPIFGIGVVTSTMSHYYSDDRGGYGFVNMIARFGIFTSFFFIIYWYKGLKLLAIINKFDSRFAIFCFISILLVLFAQGLYHSPIYLMLFFLPLVSFSKRNNVNQDLDSKSIPL